MKAIRLAPLLILASFTTNLSGQITINKFSPQIQCEVDMLDALEPLTATSTCPGELTVTTKEELFSGGCLGTIVRTFYFTDACGNKAEAQQFVQQKDTAPPQLIGVPPNINLPKGKPVPAAQMVDSRDNSGRLYEVKMTEKQEANKIIRTWTCTDDCENTASASQIITIDK